MKFMTFKRFNFADNNINLTIKITIKAVKPLNHPKGLTIKN